MSDRPLGKIVRLQVQTAAIKTKGVAYDPAPILEVEELAVGPLGATGLHQAKWVVDVHHGAHPRSRGGGKRALSVGFTGHYDRIAARFGSAPFGCAGENLLVAHPDRVVLEDLAGWLVVRTAEDEVVLGGARVAAPCAEFTSWIKGLDSVLPKTEQPEDVAFLDEGMRGFIVDVARLQAPIVLRVGDEVAVRPDR